LNMFRTLHAGEFDMSCAESPGENGDRRPIPQIGNRCQFILNDLNQRHDDQNDAYLVDLCAGNETYTRLESPVNKFRMNRASNSDSTDEDAYSDINGRYRTS